LKPVRPFCWLSECYERKFPAWEGVVFMRKLALSAAFNMAGYRSITSVFLVYLILMVSIFLQLVVRPYRRMIDVLWEICSLFALQLTVTAGMLGIWGGKSLSPIVIIPVVLVNLGAVVGMGIDLVREKREILQNVIRRLASTLLRIVHKMLGQIVAVDVNTGNVVVNREQELQMRKPDSRLRTEVVNPIGSVYTNTKVF
jgi:hypothetical protein